MSQTGPTVTPAASKNARFSSRLRAPIQPPTTASSASALSTRSVLVRNRGSSINAPWPIAASSRSAIPWVEADSATKPPSLVWYTLRGAVIAVRLPIRRSTSPVNW